MIDVRTGNYSLRPILSGPPKITDQLNAVCRTVEIPLQDDGTAEYVLGQAVELWYNNERWFYGIAFRKRTNHSGAKVLVVHDPLYYLKRNPDDWYFTNKTGTQIFQDIAEKINIKIARLEDTGAVISPLYYPGATPDKIYTDILARTYKEMRKKYWYRYSPYKDSEGLTLYEYVVPSKLWAFQAGVNLTAADLEESIEDTSNIIKLVNRDTGKTVTLMDDDGYKAYGPLVYFDEVDKDHAAYMERDAKDILDKHKKIDVTMKVEGINPGRVMPQFFSGDAIYVEDKTTKILGAYYIRNVNQVFISDDLINLSFDLMAAPDIPDIQYTDADTKGTKKAGESAAANPVYSAEVQELIKKYGL